MKYILYFVKSVKFDLNFSQVISNNASLTRHLCKALCIVSPLKLRHKIFTAFVRIRTNINKRLIINGNVFSVLTFLT